MSQTPESMLLVARLAPNPEALRRIMLAHIAFCLSPAQQFATRVAFRTVLSSAHVYESKLPSGRYDGLRVTFHRYGGQSDSCYVDGERHGPQRIWYTNGRMGYQSTFDHGTPYGARNTWHENGEPDRETHYVQGKSHGRVMIWFDSGRLCEHYNMVHDRRHGRYTSWYDGGGLRSQRHYADGVYHGSRQSWYYNGQQKKRQSYANGERVGDYMHWDANGVLVKHVVYNRTVVVSDDPEDVCRRTWQYRVARHIVWPIIRQVLTN